MALTLSKHMSIKNALIADVGSGYGGVGKALAARGAAGTWLFEYDLERAKATELEFRTSRTTSFLVVNADGSKIPAKKGSFDAVISTSVIEHVVQPELFFSELVRVIKPGGLLLLSTPNKLSILNLISDPHLNLPFVSILPRRLNKLFLEKILHVTDNYDVFDLFTIHDIKSLAAQNCIRVIEWEHDVIKAKLLEPEKFIRRRFLCVFLMFCRKRFRIVIHLLIAFMKLPLVNPYISIVAMKEE